MYDMYNGTSGLSDQDYHADLSLSLYLSPTECMHKNIHQFRQTIQLVSLKKTHDTERVACSLKESQGHQRKHILAGSNTLLLQHTTPTTLNTYGTKFKLSHSSPASRATDQRWEVDTTFLDSGITTDEMPEANETKKNMPKSYD